MECYSITSQWALRMSSSSAWRQQMIRRWPHYGWLQCTRQPNCCTKLETSEDQNGSSRQHTPKCFVPISVGFGTLWILLTPLPLLLICSIPHWFLIPVLFMVIFANVCMKNDFYYLYNQYFVHNVYHKYAAWTYFLIFLFFLFLKKLFDVDFI